MLDTMLVLWVSLMSYGTLFVYQRNCISCFYLNLPKWTYALWLDFMLKVLHLCLEGHWHRFSGEWLLIDMVGDLLWYLEQLLCSYTSISLFLPPQDFSFPISEVLWSTSWLSSLIIVSFSGLFSTLSLVLAQTSGWQFQQDFFWEV